MGTPHGWPPWMFDHPHGCLASPWVAPMGGPHGCLTTPMEVKGPPWMFCHPHGDPYGWPPWYNIRSMGTHGCCRRPMGVTLLEKGIFHQERIGFNFQKYFINVQRTLCNIFWCFCKKNLIGLRDIDSSSFQMPPWPNATLAIVHFSCNAVIIVRRKTI